MKLSRSARARAYERAPIGQILSTAALARTCPVAAARVLVLFRFSRGRSQTSGLISHEQNAYKGKSPGQRQPASGFVFRGNGRANI